MVVILSSLLFLDQQSRWKQKCTVALALYQDSKMHCSSSVVPRLFLAEVEQKLKPDRGSRFESVSFIASS